MKKLLLYNIFLKNSFHFFNQLNQNNMNNKFLSTMKMFILLFLLCPFIGMSQTKNVISARRVFPKVDKLLEFEKAIAAHAQKYHSGDTYWRVFAIQSGQDAGGFHITEGPTSWDALDSREDMGAEHKLDWNKNVAIYLTDRMSVSYSVYQDSLSTVALGDFSDKIAIAHIYPKVGKNIKVRNLIKKLKATWIADGSTVAVYAANSSGPAQFTIVTRYKQGLKEKAQGFRKPFKGTFESVNGADSYDDYLDQMGAYVDNVWSELLFLRKDLGSK
jgi:hypothetical protein